MACVSVACVSVACVSTGCGDGSGEPPDPTVTTAAVTTYTPAGAPTWYQDIQPLMAEHCWNCHGVSTESFPLTDPGIVTSIADEINVKLNTDDVPPYVMPPFPVVDSGDCSPDLPYRGDLRLTDAEKAMFQEWIDAETPLGDADAPAPYSLPESRQLGGDVVEELPGLEMTTYADSPPNAYLCWSWDLGLEEDGYLTGLRVNPDNLNILHHAVLMADLDGVTAPADGSAHGPCPLPEGEDVPDATMLGTWAPGADPFLLPENSAAHLPAGTRLVSATHYHPVDTEEFDATTLTVAWASEPPPYEVKVLALGAADPAETRSQKWEEVPFLIPAGDPDYTNTWVEPHIRQADEEDVSHRIWGWFPHAHYSMKSLRISVERTTGDSECFIDIPQWDFDWQRTYEYDAPFEELPELYSGDDFVFDCTYDNSEDNEQLMEALSSSGYDAPLDTEIGNGYLDEMCVVHALVLTEYDPDE